MKAFATGFWGGYFWAMKVFAPGALLTLAVFYAARLIHGDACG